MSGTILNCETPSNPHGKPVNSQPRNISRVTHAAAPLSARTLRADHESCPAPSACVQFMNQTHAPLNSAVYADSASQPRMGYPATGISSSHVSETSQNVRPAT